MPSTHTMCRGGDYQRNQKVKRLDVPDEKVSWGVPWPDYKPGEFTMDKVLAGPEYADPDISELHPNAKPVLKGELKFNDIDGKVNRKSHMGTYEIVDRLPRYHIKLISFRKLIVFI